MEEFTRLRESNCGKLTTSYATKLASADSKKQFKRPKKILTVDEQFQSKRSKPSEISSNIFKDLELCILTGHQLLSKSELESKVVENGGLIVQHPGASTYCVIAADKNSIRARNVIELNKYNVVKTAWIIECIEKHKLVKLCPHHFLAMTPETSEKVSEAYDEYGDSYGTRITIDRLKELMQIDPADTQILSISQMSNLDKQLFNDGNPFAVFRGCSAYFHDGGDEVSRYAEKLNLSIAKEVFKFYGGSQHDSVSKNTTHVVYSSKSHVPDNLLSRPRLILVSSNWIFDCQSSKKRLPESTYR